MMQRLDYFGVRAYLKNHSCNLHVAQIVTCTLQKAFLRTGLMYDRLQDRY